MAKRLYRSQTDSLLGGVCSGLPIPRCGSKYHQVALDPLVFVAGGGLLAYIIARISLPREPNRGYLDRMAYRAGRN